MIPYEGIYDMKEMSENIYLQVSKLRSTTVYMCFTPDARGTEYSNSVPAGTEFQNDHGCEARGVHFSLGPSA